MMVAVAVTVEMGIAKARMRYRAILDDVSSIQQSFRAVDPPRREDEPKQQLLVN